MKAAMLRRSLTSLPLMFTSSCELEWRLEGGRERDREGERGGETLSLVALVAQYYLLLRLVVSVGSFVRPCVRACVRTCEKRKRKPHARAPGCTFDL